MRQGEIDRSLGIIMSGSADLVVVDGRGAEHRLAVMDAPSVVGEVSFLDAGPRSAFALIALLFVRPRDGLIAWWLFILPCIPRY